MRSIVSFWFPGSLTLCPSKGSLNFGSHHCTGWRRPLYPKDSTSRDYLCTFRDSSKLLFGVMKRQPSSVMAILSYGTGIHLQKQDQWRGKLAQGQSR
jgi:hypothetical protein